MLYEVITESIYYTIILPAKLGVIFVFIFTFSGMQKVFILAEILCRITSYNVCYTKLLRAYAGEKEAEQGSDWLSRPMMHSAAHSRW